MDSPSLSNLGGIEYIPGFEPVTPEFFDQVKQADLRLSAMNAAVREVIAPRLPEVWAMLGKIDFKLTKYEIIYTLYGAGEHAKHLNKQLRQLYPELGMLTNEQLYCLWHQHEVSEHKLFPFERITDISERREDFVLSLLGGFWLTGEHVNRGSVNAGGIVACALFRGDSVKDAKKLGRMGIQHNDAVKQLAIRIRDAFKACEQLGEDYWALPPDFAYD